MAFVAAYLLLPALQAVNRFVFHPESFEPTIILILFWLYERARGAAIATHISPQRAQHGSLWASALSCHIFAAATNRPLVWYPTSRWRVGEVVRVRVNTITWSTENIERFDLALGMLTGEQPTQPEQRLTVQAVAGYAPPTLLACETLVKTSISRRATSRRVGW